MTFKEAERLALDYLRSNRDFPIDDYPVILYEPAQEFDVGWYLFYNGRKICLRTLMHW